MTRLFKDSFNVLIFRGLFGFYDNLNMGGLIGDVLKYTLNAFNETVYS